MKRSIFSVVLATVMLAFSMVAYPAAMSNYLQNKAIDHVFRGQIFTAPTTLCVALTTVTPTAASTGATLAEATYTGYARGQLNPSVSNWLGTGGETAGASAGTTGTTKNNTTITIGAQATSGPTVVTSFAVLDSCVVGSGNVLFYSTLSSAKTINSGDPAPIFAINALNVQLQ
jgi:hypothetical protein